MLIINFFSKNKLQLPIKKQFNWQSIYLCSDATKQRICRFFLLSICSFFFFNFTFTFVFFFPFSVLEQYFRRDLRELPLYLPLHKRNLWPHILRICVILMYVKTRLSHLQTLSFLPWGAYELLNELRPTHTT